MLQSLIFLSLAAAPPAAAAPSPQAPLAAASADAAAKLALARRAAMAIVPPGTMESVLKNSLGGGQSAAWGAMLDMKGSDLGATGDGADQTLRDAVLEKDPAFEERMSITNRVMAEEMGKVFATFEPQLRESMAKAYAKKFTVPELEDINRFFDSASGRKFASQSYAMMADPDLMKDMMGAMPAVMKAMPDILKKVEKATAHLPPPPKDEERDEEEPEA